jgi:hypothetical protein
MIVTEGYKNAEGAGYRGDWLPSLQNLLFEGVAENFE